jgi:hypothetical protein
MQRHLTTAAALLAAGLLVAGCSGDGGSPEDDGIAGTETGQAQPSPTADTDPADDDPEPGPDDGIDRPEIELPDDVINVFEEVDTDDPVELAVLADQENFINAVDEAVTSGETDRPALPFYTSGDALLAALDYISGMHDDNLSFTGTTRYYHRTLTLREEGVATTAYCIDFSGTRLVDRDTGQTSPDSEDRYFYATRQELNDVGVWETVYYTSEAGAPQCD